MHARHTLDLPYARPFGQRPDYDGLLFFAQYVRHSLISYGYKCTPIIRTCQGIFAWYTYSAMNTVACAVLLTIVQTFPPVPGKTANTGTHTSRKIKKHSGE